LAEALFSKGVLDYSRAEIKGKIDDIYGAEIKLTTEFKSHPYCILITKKDKYLPISFKDEETMKQWNEVLVKYSTLDRTKIKPVIIEKVEDNKVVFEAL